MHQLVGLPPGPAEIRELLVARVPPQVIDLLYRAGALGDRLGYVVCLAGGIVRDLIIGVPSEDADLLVEGDGLALAEALNQDLGGTLVRHERFQTVTVMLPATERLPAGLKVDVATARRESYDYPASLPRVEAAGLREDFYRRDFTINAMAIRLNQGRFGVMVDYFGGYQDLADGIIRVLHDRSFVEDPTRIFRAVRFAQRFGFAIEPGTLALAAAPGAQTALERLSGPRLWAELSRLLEEDDLRLSIRQLEEVGVLARIFPGKVTAGWWRESAERVYRLAREWKGVSGQTRRLRQAIVCLAVVLGRADAETALAVGHRFSLRKQELEILCRVSQVVAMMAGSVDRQFAPGRWHRILRDQPVETVLAGLAVSGREEITPGVMAYLRACELLPSLISGDDLRQMGQTPGPVFANILLDLECAFLDREVRGREEALAWVRAKLNRKGDL